MKLPRSSDGGSQTPGDEKGLSATIFAPYSLFYFFHLETTHEFLCLLT